MRRCAGLLWLRGVRLWSREGDVVDGMVNICWVFVGRQRYISAFSFPASVVARVSPAPTMSARCKKNNQACGKNIHSSTYTSSGYKAVRIPLPPFPDLSNPDIQGPQTSSKRKPPRCTSMHPSPTPGKTLSSNKTPVDDIAKQRCTSECGM
jgi:hypothetical protein